MNQYIKINFLQIGGNIPVLQLVITISNFYLCCNWVWKPQKTESHLNNQNTTHIKAHCLMLSEVNFKSSEYFNIFEIRYVTDLFIPKTLVVLKKRHICYSPSILQ